MALRGGPSFVLATEPLFRAEIETSIENQSPFHPESPAGKLLNSFKDSTRFKIQFNDPHEARGGFGGSTAEWLVIQTLKENSLMDSMKFSMSPAKTIQWWEEYRSSFAGIQPSGADLVAQIQGGMVLWDGNTKSIQKRSSWPFPNLNFFLIRTGEKIQTHQHLKNQNHEPPWKPLKSQMEKILSSLNNQDSKEFAEGIHHYGMILREAGLQSEKSRQICDTMMKAPGVLAAKGCGAFGADVVLVLTEVSRFREFCHDKGLEVIADQTHLAEGLRFEELK